MSNEQIVARFAELLGADWMRVAVTLGIEHPDRSQWTRGSEGLGIWEWLQARDELGRLPQALLMSRRADLAELVESACVRPTAPEPTAPVEQPAEEAPPADEPVVEQPAVAEQPTAEPPAPIPAAAPTAPAATAPGRLSKLAAFFRQARSGALLAHVGIVQRILATVGLPKSHPLFGVEKGISYAMTFIAALAALLPDAPQLSLCGALAVLMTSGFALVMLSTHVYRVKTGRSDVEQPLLGGLWKTREARVALRRGGSVVDVLREHGNRADAVWPAGSLRMAQAVAALLLPVFAFSAFTILKAVAVLLQSESGTQVP